MKSIVDFIVHIDTHLASIIAAYGSITYGILFSIIFIETGVIIMPFLPGDSLLFAAGAFAAKGSFNIVMLWSALTVAAILGDTVNYMVGNRFGRVLTGYRTLIKPEHLERTAEFFERYGAKAIVFARFVPIVRTCAPFVAGIGKMSYKKFIQYNVIGAILWVTLFLFLGYFFGGLPVVEKNFSMVILGIIVVSLMPAVYEWWRGKSRK